MIEVNELSLVNRRDFLKQSAAVGAMAVAGETLANAAAKQVFKISLAQWSLHKALFKKELDNLDFAKTAKQDFGQAQRGRVQRTQTVGRGVFVEIAVRPEHDAPLLAG